MPTPYFSFYDSPVGLLKIKSDGESITSIEFIKSEDDELDGTNEVIVKCKKQLDEYFNGNRSVFDLPLNPAGTEFQKKVWAIVRSIPFSETSSYLTIAKLLGNEKLTRAVGLANGANPIPIIIPCHRVIGKNKRLTGYSGGIDKKRWLLLHEMKNSPKAGKQLLF